jgi:hypothetical protein
MRRIYTLCRQSARCFNCGRRNDFFHGTVRSFSYVGRWVAKKFAYRLTFNVFKIMLPDFKKKLKLKTPWP